MTAPTPAPIESVSAEAYTVPTDAPESDGTLSWGDTTVVVVEVRAGGASGLGYSYTHAAAAALVASTLGPLLRGRDAHGRNAAFDLMRRAVRNLGKSGLVATAISAVDVALWDLGAKLLGCSLLTLLGGAAREAAPQYGSGGFTSYPVERLRRQLREWAEGGMAWVKMKVGRDPDADVQRVRAAREAIGAEVGLFVDANGAYTRKQALRMAERFAEQGVSWFEEPVSSQDLDGLRLLRDRAPAGMAIAAGEYGYELSTFRRLLDAGAVDVLQADVTRAQGFTGFLHVAALCRAHDVPLSAHCAPALSAHLGCALEGMVHAEHFHDHARLEALLFEGVPRTVGGRTHVDRSVAGHGLRLDREAAASYRTEIA